MNNIQKRLFLQTVCLLLTLKINDVFCGPNRISARSREVDTCLSLECNRTAAEILIDMDTTVNPCDDFYQFACGNFIKNAVMPEGENLILPITLLNSIVKEQLRTTIEQPVTDKDIKPFQLLKHVYNSCMDQKATEAEGLKVLKDLMKLNGGWPVLEGNSWTGVNSEGDAFNWKQLVLKLAKIGFKTHQLFKFVVVPDVENSAKRIIRLYDLTQRFENQVIAEGLENADIKSYFKYMVDIAIMFGADRQTAEKELKESLNFELELNKIALPEDKYYEPIDIYNPMTLAKVQTKYPIVNWVEYINSLIAPSGVTVDAHETITVANPKYLSEIEQILSKTPQRVQANYIMWRIIDESVDYLTTEMRAAKIEYGSLYDQPLQEECFEYVMANFKVATDALYVRNFFNGDAKQNAVEIVAEVRNPVYNLLRQLDWMDDETRNYALEKAYAMHETIAYPDELLDDQQLLDYYETLDVSFVVLLENALKLNSFHMNDMFKYVRLVGVKTHWTEQYLTDANAYYIASTNSLDFPAAIFSGRFFHKDRPRYLNYGAIGFIVSHEITHGFDTKGRNYDKDGNFVNWWKGETENIFKNKAQCISDLYKTYYVPEVNMHLSGNISLAEDIADIGAAKIAYFAYKNWAKNNVPEKRLRGLEHYTPEQMFWISGAHLFCGVYTPKGLKEQIEENRHSPVKYRIIGAFSNNDDFAKDFNCPAGAKMNPVHKCHLW